MKKGRKTLVLLLRVATVVALVVMLGIAAQPAPLAQAAPAAQDTSCKMQGYCPGIQGVDNSRKDQFLQPLIWCSYQGPTDPVPQNYLWDGGQNCWTNPYPNAGAPPAPTPLSGQGTFGPSAEDRAAICAGTSVVPVGSNCWDGKLNHCNVVVQPPSPYSGVPVTLTKSTPPKGTEGTWYVLSTIRKPLTVAAGAVRMRVDANWSIYPAHGTDRGEAYWYGGTVTCY